MAFKEAADLIEGTVKEKVVYVGGEQEDRPVVVRVEYSSETPGREISCDSKT